jgi:tetratricopeptide (TPR) repeat protein
MSTGAFADSYSGLYQQANQYYQAGDYAKAIGTYEQIVKDGFESGELYYNLANAYYKSGRIPESILFYERAKRLLPRDEDVEQNLQVANLRVVDKIEAMPHLFLADYWNGFNNYFSLDGLTTVALVFYFLLLGSIGVFMLTRNYVLKKWSFVGGSVTLIIFLLMTSVFILRIHRYDHEQFAIVFADVVSVKSSPDEKGTDVFLLHSGLKVEITDELSEWVKIRLADGKVGWVKRKIVEVI